MNAYEQKVAARLERLRARAAARRAQGESLVEGAHRMAAVIPFGQPILCGHHSEKTDRNYRGRIDGKFRKGFEALSEARELERRAAAAETSSVISSDDPEAIAKLQDKLADLESFRARAVLVNNAIRAATRSAKKLGLPARDAQAEALRKAGLSERAIDAALAPDCFGNIGVPSFKLTNLAAEARRCRERIAVLQQAAAQLPREPEHVGELTIEEADNRVRLIFPGKPADETRALLKSRGFRWSPTAGAWQRQATPAAWYAARELAKQIARP